VLATSAHAALNCDRAVCAGQCGIAEPVLELRTVAGQQ
jgi:hypothetical protein